MNRPLNLFTDGPGRSSGPIGWAFIVAESQEKILACEHGVKPEGTSNVAEMVAVLQGLKYVSQHYPESPVTVHSDSAYVINAFKDRWFDKWIKNNWRTSNKKKKVANREIWEELLAIAHDLNVSWQHVPGHAGIPLNEECDRLAGQARKSIQENRINE